MYAVCNVSVTGLEEVPEPREIHSGEGKLKIDDTDTYTPVQTCNVCYLRCIKILKNYRGVHGGRRRVGLGKKPRLECWLFLAWNEGHKVTGDIWHSGVVLS